MAATPNPYLHVQQRKHLDFFNWLLFAKVAKFMAGRRISLHLPCCQKTDLAQVSFLLFVFRGLSKGLCLWDCGLCVIGMSFCLPMCVGLFLFDRLLEFEYLSLSLCASVFVLVCLCLCLCVSLWVVGSRGGTLCPSDPDLLRHQANTTHRPEDPPSIYT